MKLYKVTLADLLGREWIERIDAEREQEIKDIIYARYGMAAAVVAVSR